MKPMSYIGIQVFEAIESTHKRLQLLQDLAHYELTNYPDDLEFILETVIPSIRRAGKFRNDVAHGNWCISDTYPNEIILNSWDETAQVYSVADFDKALLDIENSSAAIIKSVMRMSKIFCGK